MRSFLKYVLLSFVVVLSATCPIWACTCHVSPLQTRFKKAEAVFIGRYMDSEPKDRHEIQNYKQDLFFFEVVKSWKGVNKEYVAIDLGEFPSSGSCPRLFRFDQDAEYLIFAYGNDLKIQVECSDTKALKPRYNETMEEISKLDSSWFRFKARVWPF